MTSLGGVYLFILVTISNRLTTAQISTGTGTSGESHLQCKCTCEQPNKPGKDVFLSGTFNIDSGPSNAERKPPSAPHNGIVKHTLSVTLSPIVDDTFTVTNIPTSETTNSFMDLTTPDIHVTSKPLTSQTPSGSESTTNHPGTKKETKIASETTTGVAVKPDPKGIPVNSKARLNGKGNSGKQRKIIPRNRKMSQRSGQMNKSKSQGPGRKVLPRRNRNGNNMGHRRNEEPNSNRRRQLLQMKRNNARNHRSGNISSKGPNRKPNLRKNFGNRRQAQSEPRKQNSSSTQADLTLNVSPRDKAIIELIKSLADRNKGNSNQNNNNNNNRQNWNNGGRRGKNQQYQTTTNWYQQTTTFPPNNPTTQGYSGNQAGPGYSGFGISGPFGAGMMGIDMGMRMEQGW